MCHIPVFCWISATVLQRIMKQPHTEIPKTLTEMYSHFLLTQTNMKNEKYEEKDERDPKNLLESNRTMILKLAELAFKQLMKGNVMFYEEDLRESSIDVTETSVYSEIFTEIFREECVLHQRKVYCFVHLSFQEFLAAVYVFHCYEIKNMKELEIFNPWDSKWSKNIPLDELLEGTVDTSVESQNGHLDLFLRFLLGISLESNQRRLQGLLTPTQSSSERTREHIKSLIRGNQISTERSINLFLCLSEVNDQSVSRKIQENLNSERHSEEKLSPGQCSALACMILSSVEVLDELDLKKYNTSEEGYRRLIPAVTVCRKARLKCAGSPQPSCVSMKSDWSMPEHPGFSRGGGEPSRVSMKSDWSMPEHPSFSRGGGEPSCVSMKSGWSMPEHPSFSRGAVPSESELSSTEPALQINTLLEGTGDLNQDSYQPVDDDLHRVLQRHKTSMKNKYESLFEGIRTEENKTLLNRIYTQLYIIEGESEGVNEEHEVLQMEKTPRRHLQDSPINCLDIFKPLQGPEGETREETIRAVKADRLRHREREDHRPEEPELRAVLTKGIAGIGKTVSVQKFILDWAEGKANQDVELMTVLPFRELNLIKDDQYSLHGLLCDFHPELKDLDPEIYDQIKAVFIFDGLDENRIPLNFEQCEEVSDITMTSSVGVLMTNLIKGELLPSALIWITSRPAAANQIPPKYINRVTEIQGFSDPQKEEYFRKRISDEDQAQKIISHIKTVRSLHIMCHIPVFCWISATVLQRIMKQPHTEIPKTLTEMYSHFLITQTNMKNEKYEEEDERNPKNLLESNRTMILKLAELAFKQLMKGNVMFYEEDLRESSIDVTEASVYSGIFTEIFREECVLHQRKVYCFVHLSFQEFLAAVYVFHCYEIKNMKELEIFNPWGSKWSKNIPLDELLEGAVDTSVESQNGHLDLFLRFLLGISLESNQRLLQGLLTPTQRSSERTRGRIKSLIKGNQTSTERSINLFLCLSEVNDQSVSRKIQENLNSERHSEEKLSPGQCSALACMLLNSGEVLDELDLRKYNTSEEGYRRLIPAVTVCRKARLVHCNLTKKSCETLCSALQSANSSLKELDLSNNDLQDSGVQVLSVGLKSSHCKLEILRLVHCNLTKKSCETLCSALQSANSSLKELALSNNDLQDSGVQVLSVGLKSSHCKLEILRLSGCMVTAEGCSSLASAMKSNPSHLRELDLSYNHPGESGVKLLSDIKEDPHCALEKLRVDHGGENRMKQGLKKYAVRLTLDPNTVNRELSLSEGNRKVTQVGEDQSYPDHPDRFDDCLQALSAESLTGCCYWEAEWSWRWGGIVAVSYRGIARKKGSSDCRFGSNNQSWAFIHSNNRYTLRHNNQLTAIPYPPNPSTRVGVYLDWESGTLSFYSVSPGTHTLTHLHTLYTTFTEPLYTGLRVYNYDSVRLC
ncbi:NACHT, LRR and PYD domains-containing protein 3-like [Colossoma macropomum]|uniref:NACHT, LRR and PYD domains-containing protein 3-like n=1 Tax=Colossoma macropomum TaxID=42526 RepID=UPI001864B284|nr:NACHT, LRR and PYD domains-containing protein 3-like [Colossoma macropomum]